MSKENSKYDNDSIAFLADIRAGVRRSRAAAVAMAVCLVAAVAAAFAFTYMYTLSQKEQVYVIDQGSVLTASRADGMPQKDLEIRDHVTRFHQLFYNVAPNIDMINANTAMALEYGDESVYRFFSDLKERQFYSRLISINAVQQIQVDSVRIVMEEYPYRVHTWCSLYLLRESNISRYDYQTECEVVDVPRSQANPHGLQMRRFLQVCNDLVGTRKTGN